jgi:hypothetical protein
MSSFELRRIIVHGFEPLERLNNLTDRNVFALPRRSPAAAGRRRVTFSPLHLKVGVGRSLFGRSRGDPPER